MTETAITVKPGPGLVLQITGDQTHILGSRWISRQHQLSGLMPEWGDVAMRWLDRWRSGVDPGLFPARFLSFPQSFSGQVWLAMCDVPHGQVATYGQLARAIGRPGAARAVAGACGRNPWPLLVPCHRIVAAGGSGGYSGGQGVRTKANLLFSEGALPDPTPSPTDWQRIRRCSLASSAFPLRQTG